MLKLYMNIRDRRKELHMTQAELADKVGYSGKSMIAKIENGKIDLSQSKIMEFAKVLHTTPAALMGWDDVVTPVDLSDTVSIPVYGRIPAGVPRRSEEYVDEHIQVPRSWTIGGQELAGLRVSGESMLPLIQDGDLVVYQYQPDIESGSIGICRIDGDDATVKKVIKQEPHTVILQPLNPAFQPIIFTGDATEPTLEIIGKVIEVRHRL
ncbi:MAG: LexA family transcriptional regulator [Clostridiales bacterium]|nr:LexA family transcriptional regulator [Clostridiales bacterium]